MSSRPMMILLAATLFMISAPFCRGQSSPDHYPNRPITLIVGLGAGGAADVTARIFADKAGQILGQRIVVENRGGGGGIPAALAVKRAEPDGYTLLFVLANLHSVTPLVQRLPFDPIDDFTMIAELYSAPSFLTVNANTGAKSVADYVRIARGKTSQLTYGSPGQASPGHLMGILFGQATGLPDTHVPFRGSGQISGELISERLDFAFTTFPNINQFIGEGAPLKALAIASPGRWSFTPDIPTMTEAGYGGIDVDNLFGIAGPKGLPLRIVKKLNEAFRQAGKDPEIVARLPALGAVAHDSEPEELLRLIRADAAKLAPLVKHLDVSGQ